MSHSYCDNTHLAQPRRGLTLLELVIVLVILAALTGIAVVSLEPIAEQSRYESTQQTLINVDEAIASRSFTSDRVMRYSGFIADLGRLPVAVGMDRETQLSELWSQGALPTFSIADYNDPDTTETEAIPVAAGWRGPYLKLPPGPSALRDGFGQAFTIVNPSGVDADETDPIVNLISAGANGLVNASDANYDRDLELPGGAWTAGRYEGSIDVAVVDSSGNAPNIAADETIRVKMYGPVNGLPGILAEEQITGPSDIPVSLTISDQTIGPRVLVAYVTKGPDSTQSVEERSSAKQIVLAPGINPSVTLTLSP